MRENGRLRECWRKCRQCSLRSAVTAYCGTLITPVICLINGRHTGDGQKVFLNFVQTSLAPCCGSLIVLSPLCLFMCECISFQFFCERCQTEICPVFHFVNVFIQL